MTFQNPHSLPLRTRLTALALAASIGWGGAAALAPNYLDGAGEGFNDPTLGADRKNAFEYALGLWASVLGEAYSGETVVVDAQFDPLGGGATSAVLGFGGPLGSGFALPGTSPLPGNVFYSGALRNHISGSDQVAGSEARSTFNSDVDGAALGSTVWYYGIDNMAPPGTLDFVTTALHEIGHGLGWSGTLDVSETLPDTSPNPGYGDYLNGALINSFDHFVERTPDGAALSSLSTADRIAAVTGDDISWGGALGTAANGGTEPDFYSPNPTEPGSSYAHLDEGDFPLELMSPFETAGTGHGLPVDGLSLAILADQGWTIVPEPSSALLLFGTFGLIALRRRRYSV